MKTHKKNSLLIKTYHQVLTSEWSFETFEQCLLLADSFLNQYALGFSEFIKKNKNLDSIVLFSSSSLINFLKDQSTLLRDNHLPSVPDRLPKRRSAEKSRYSLLTLEVMYNLGFPIFSSKADGSCLEENICFFRDIQSLILILASEYILPILKKQRLKEEYDFLNLIMFTHSLVAWHDNPAHQNQLFSIIFDNLGFQEAVIDCLYVAFRLTDPDDHDYLTKAQAYWAALIDAEMFDKAKAFTFKLLRNSPEKHFEELKEMIELIFELDRGVGVSP